MIESGVAPLHHVNALHLPLKPARPHEGKVVLERDEITVQLKVTDVIQIKRSTEENSGGESRDAHPSPPSSGAHRERQFDSYPEQYEGREWIFVVVVSLSLHEIREDAERDSKQQRISFPMLPLLLPEHDGESEGQHHHFYFFGKKSHHAPDIGGLQGAVKRNHPL